jgi:hypothetical protein
MQRSDSELVGSSGERIDLDLGIPLLDYQLEPRFVYLGFTQ